MTNTASIQLPEKLVDVFDGEARYRGAYGGRGSAKTRTFALMTAVRAFMVSQEGKSGVIVCAREFMNSLDDSSMAEVKTAIRETPWLAPHFDIGEKYIRTADGRVTYNFVGLRQNLDSIKSKARILLCWVDEAEPVSESAWAKLIPTVREDGSEIWITWNPESKRSATHKRFRESPPDGAKIVSMNWRDNPWFPAVLDAERRQDRVKRQESYAHIWEGDFNDQPQGAYFGTYIADMRAQNRLCRVNADPHLTTFAMFDIGGAGKRSDARSIWIVQYVGSEVRVLRYRETQGQPLAVDIEWLNSLPNKPKVVLPHDGVQSDRVYAATYESTLKAAGFDVTVIPNQGTGAALMRVEAVRRMFPQVYMDVSCEEDGGLAALAAYHEKRDERRNIGLGPNHNWASHAADAFGLVAIHHDTNRPSTLRKVVLSPVFAGGGQGWLGA